MPISYDIHGKYYSAARARNLYCAFALVSGPVGYTSSSAVGGPLLWNNAVSCETSIVAIGYAVNTAPTSNVSLGFSGAKGQTTAPTSTTAIDAGPACLYINGQSAVTNVYRVGTVTNNSSWFMPFAELTTAALTTNPGKMTWLDVGGAVLIPYQSWWAPTCSASPGGATITHIGVIWEEIPIP